MTSATLGRNTSRVEVTNVSPHRFWLFVDEEELFRVVQRIPVVHGRVHSRISHVELPSPHHLYWPDFDIDLAVESLMHPERYPLVSQTPPKRRVQAKPLRRMANTRASRSRLRS